MHLIGAGLSAENTFAAPGDVAPGTTAGSATPLSGGSSVTSAGGLDAASGAQGAAQTHSISSVGTFTPSRRVTTTNSSVSLANFDISPYLTGRSPARSQQFVRSRRAPAPRRVALCLVLMLWGVRCLLRTRSSWRRSRAPTRS